MKILTLIRRYIGCANHLTLVYMADILDLDPNNIDKDDNDLVFEILDKLEFSSSVEQQLACYNAMSIPRPHQIWITNYIEKNEESISDELREDLEKCRTDVTCNNGMLLRWACTMGHLDLVQILVKNEALRSYIHLKRWNTCLVSASERGHLDIVRLLIETYNAKEEFSVEEILEALKGAIQGGFDKIVHFILTNDITPRLRLDLSRIEDCIKSAIRKGHLQVIKTIVETRPQTPTVMADMAVYATYYDQGAIVKYLLVDCGVAPLYSSKSRRAWSAEYPGHLFSKILQKHVDKN